MNDITSSVIAIAGEIAIASTGTDSVQLWVSCICSALIAIATCALQIYKMFKNRDNDETKKEETKETKEETKEDDENIIR